ncbi:sensor histidine kinase [Salinispira pacifica]
MVSGIAAAFSIPNYFPVLIITLSITALLVALALWSNLPNWAADVILAACLLLVATQLRFFFPYLFRIDVVLGTLIVVTFAQIVALSVAAVVRISPASIPVFLSAILAEWALFRRINGEPAWMWGAVAAVTVLVVLLSYLLIEYRSERLRTLSLLHERDELNRRLAQSGSQLIEKKQQETFAMIAASVVHEINNPLNYLRGNLEFLRRYIDRLLCDENAGSSSEGVLTQAERAELREIVESFETGVGTIAQVVKSIRAIFQGSAAKPENVHLAQVVASSARAAGVVEARAVETVIDVPKDLIVSCNPTDLYTLIVNLLRNSLEAIDGSGRIRLSACVKGERASILVEDNGPGISQKDVEQVFDPYFSTKVDRGGFGIGLTLCRAIVEHYGGSLRLDSGPGGPTSFSFDLPLAVGGEDLPAAAHR